MSRVQKWRKVLKDCGTNNSMIIQVVMKYVGSGIKGHNMKGVAEFGGLGYGITNRGIGNSSGINTHKLQ